MKENKKIIIITVVLVIATILFKVLVHSNGTAKLDIDKILDNKETRVIYVESKDSDKCSKCREIENHIDKTGIKYSKYIVEDYDKEEYKKMLKELNINTKEFGYPAIIYIKEGFLYSDLINIPSTKLVDNYIKDYNLKSVK